MNKKTKKNNFFWGGRGYSRAPLHLCRHNEDFLASCLFGCEKRWLLLGDPRGGGAMYGHAQQLVEDVEVEEVYLGEGGVEQRERLDDQRPVSGVFLKQHSQEMPCSLDTGMRVCV